MRSIFRSAAALTVFAALFCAGVADAAPNQASVVTVSGRQLLLQRRQPDGSLTAPAPYVIKGMNWAPGTAAPRLGPDPTLPPPQRQNQPYGFFFDYPGRPGLQGHDLMNVWLRQEVQNRYVQDIPLMAQMNVNTVRVYLDFDASPTVTRQILDTFYDNNIMVIMTVVSQRSDIDTSRYLQSIATYKNHPAILMWSIGNEWNLNSPPLYGYSEGMTAAIAAVNQAAASIKAADGNHPVSSSIGDTVVLPPNQCPVQPDPNRATAVILAGVPNVDIWGINVFRGTSFGNFFTQWQSVSSKPFYFSEFGTDSLKTLAHDKPFFNPPCEPDGRARVRSSVEDQATQAAVFTGLWNEISAHLSALNPAESSVGGVVFEFNDEIWKVGDYNVSLGGLVDLYDGADGIPGTGDDDTSYGTYNPDGFEVIGAHPDNVANEEYFGVVNANRQPKAAFNAVRLAFGGVPSMTLTKNVDKLTARSGDVVTYSIQYRNTSLSEAKNVVIRDGLPAGTVLVPGSITGGGSLVGQTIQWPLGNLPSAAAGVVGFQVQVL